jgi:hypothetical protein
MNGPAWACPKGKGAGAERGRCSAAAPAAVATAPTLRLVAGIGGQAACQAATRGETMPEGRAGRNRQAAASRVTFMLRCCGHVDKRWISAARCHPENDQRIAGL